MACTPGAFDGSWPGWGPMMVPGDSPTAWVTPAAIARLCSGVRILAPMTAAAATAATTATAVAIPSGERSREPTAESLPISTVPHDVGQAQVLSGYQPVVLVEDDPVPAQHRPHDVEGLPQVLERLADAVGMGGQRAGDVVDPVDDRRDLPAVKHRDAVHDASQFAEQAEEFDDVDRLRGVHLAEDVELLEQRDELLTPGDRGPQA